MKMLDFMVLLMLFITLGFGSYVLWLNFPGETRVYQPVVGNYSYPDLPDTQNQFLPNMRYVDSVISYKIEPDCSEKKRQDIISSFNILESETVLQFEESGDGEIKFLCSQVAPEPEQKNHFVAGEGGPAEIVNTSLYYVILSGKVSLFRSEKCDEPKIALHEILHALGFDHVNNRKSIMYPVTDCDQELDPFIVQEIDRLYSVDAAQDLAIERITANRTGRYLQFYASVINRGLLDAQDVKLTVYSDGEEIKEYDLDDISIGAKKFLTVQNLRISGEDAVLRFVVTSQAGSNELSMENNEVELILE